MGTVLLHDWPVLALDPDECQWYDTAQWRSTWLAGWDSGGGRARPASLRDNTENKRALLEQQRIHRGTIRAVDGTVLARSVKVRGGIYTRRYSDADGDTSQAVGYSYTNLGQVGLEKSRNDELTGETNGIESVVDQVLGK